jgi:molybdate transport system substrate-binding protein
MKKLCVALIVVLFASSVQADPLRSAAGAGYKRFVEKWANLYEKTSNKAMERIYGNMGQVTAQVKHGGGICVVVGDRSYLSSHDMPISRYIGIGRGRPVLVSRKGLTLSSVEDLKKPEFVKVAAPDFTKAIYGRAAHQILTSGGYDAVLAKTMEAGTVPRSGAYAISGEVDAAFINLSFALANQDKFGSMVELTKGFEPIEIAAGIVSGCEENADLKAFLDLLATPAMKKNVTEAGL